MARALFLTVALLLACTPGVARRHLRSDPQTLVAPASASAVEAGAVQVEGEGEHHDEEAVHHVDAALADDDNAITVGFISWNVAEVLGEVNGAALTSAVRQVIPEEGKPDYFGFAFQENLFDQTETVAWLETYALGGAYKLISYVARGNSVFKKQGHGNSGIALFALKSVEVPQSALSSLASGGHGFKVWKNNEKGLSVAVVTVNGKKLCFGSSHLSPGSDAADRKRLEKFDKYAKKMEDLGCHAAWYGGDFNWRNGDWADLAEGQIHPHYLNAGVQAYYAALSIDHSDFVDAVQSELGAWPLGADERQERRSHWKEGNQVDKNTALNIPPSFQPAECPADPGANKPDTLVKDDTGAYMYEGHKIKKEEPVCLKTAEGGNCPGGYICSSALRPLAYTDAIYVYQPGGVTVTCTKYGVGIRAQASDHFPMAGAYNVVLQ